ncbi:MAG: hypothetical protein ACK47B_03275 [Armatimonadota bacterium]
MIRNDDDLRVAHENVRKLELFLAAARRTHAPGDYTRMAEPFLLELQERQREIVSYLSAAHPQDAAA